VSYRVPFIRPIFPDPQLLAEDYAEIVESNWFTNFGPKERQFSAAIGEYLGSGLHAVTFANATIALMGLVQSALGRGDGSRHILVPSFTFAAGPAAIEWAGYRPYFVDIDPDTLQPSLESALVALAVPGLDFAGILLCNTFGIGHGEIERWESSARDQGLPLLIDSAAGFGSRYTAMRAVGTAGLAEVFSFHATKPFAIGEGGAIVTRDAELAERLREFQNFGFIAGRGSLQLGLNGKLQEINAAIGLRQLGTIDAVVADRQSVVAAYRAAFAGLGITVPHNLENSAVCFATVLLPSRKSRDAALESLLVSGIEARAYYTPVVHAQPHFEGALGADSLPATSMAASRVLSLPVHQKMSTELVAEIAQLVRNSVASA
jgi:dTDP-4-amino-4,6-dideoxygalactose transaminase